jgi:cytochrome P450
MKISSSAFSQNPYLIYDELRKSGNVHYLEKEKGWLIIGYNEITTILLNSKIFTSEGDNSFDPILLNCDPPKHTQHKNIISGDKGILSNNRIDNFSTKNRIICNNIIESFKNKFSIDLLQDFALPYSSQVIMNLLGFPVTNNKEISKWSYQSVSNDSIYDADFAYKQWLKIKPIIEDFISESSKTDSKQGFSDLFSYNLISSFSSEELLNLIKVLILGGNETTPNLISSALFYLLKTPNLLNIIKKDTSLIPAFLNEILRIEAPTQIIQRTTKEEVLVGDKLIPANSLLYLSIGAANRDPDIFDNPDNFDMNRKSVKILSFGFGPHYCIGANLARQEAQIALEVLISHFPDLNINRNFSPTYRNSSHIRGIKEFPLSLKKKDIGLVIKHRLDVLKIIVQDFKKYNEFPSFENYPKLNTNDWFYTYSSPFIHSNVLYSLLNSNFDGKTELLEKAKNVIINKKETGDVWRFWNLDIARNAVPPDMDDTAMCTFVLKKMDVLLNNDKVFLNALSNNSEINTWIFPSINLLISNPKLFIKLVLESKKVKHTISSKMLSYKDFEIGVSANVLLVLGENSRTKSTIEKIMKDWELDLDNCNFYDKKIVTAFHIARAYKEGIKSFKSIETSMIKLIESNYKNYCFAELLLCGLILKYFESNCMMNEIISFEIINGIEKNEDIITHYPYFTSKDRNYYGGSRNLTAAWFLEYTNDWVYE